MLYNHHIKAKSMKLHELDHILRCNLNLTLSPPVNMDFKGTVKLKGSVQYGSW